jgi:hypothetical protein
VYPRHKTHDASHTTYTHTHTHIHTAHIRKHTNIQHRQKHTSDAQPVGVEKVTVAANQKVVALRQLCVGLIVHLPHTRLDGVCHVAQIHICGGIALPMQRCNRRRQNRPYVCTKRTSKRTQVHKRERKSVYVRWSVKQSNHLQAHRRWR